MKNVTIIIPVYRGLDETRECILSVVDNLPVWAELLVINDCSPENELTEWLRVHAKEKQYHLSENEKNKGFVETVNKGMKLAKNNDVLLLNSDVEAPNSDWLDRIRTAAYSRDKLASITPFSNNATICSFPNFCDDNELFYGLDTTQLDSVFSSLELDNNLVEVPTGVGFCMYIKRDCLNSVGYFDHETFGKGYGEENDWCQRAHKAGWKNYHQLNVFAYHKGGVSFAEEGDPRKEKALELLQELHPNYTLDVQNFITNDPAKRARFLAILKILQNSTKKKILFVSHSLGGGVNQHLDELEEYYKERVNYLKLIPVENGKSISLSLSSAINHTVIFEIPSDYNKLIDLLRLISLDRIHFHHTMGLPARLFGLPNDLNLSYDITIHDYYLVNGNPTLTDLNGRFVGDDDTDRDKLCGQSYPIPTSAVEWRKGAEPLLIGAQRIIFPSLDVANRFNQVFANISEKTVVAYHPDTLLHDSCSENVKYQPNNSPKKVLVLGALSKEKGADLLESTAINSELEFHLLGYAYRPLEKVTTTGPYEISLVDKYIEDINPDYIWFPALWPETYSYTLSIALRHNCPIICPNIGAFPERVLNRDDSIICPWNMTSSDYVTFFFSIILVQ